MGNKAYQSQKVTLKYSKNAIDKSVRKIRHGCINEERDDAIRKIQNFREIHMYPLMLIKNHLIRTAKRVSNTVIVARRLKRLPTIINKLERPTLDGKESNAIKLTRMQDIGGCRAIVKDLQQLKLLHKKLVSSSCVHEIIHTSNYLIPKESGYGGIHLIYSCFNKYQGANDWKKTKIEIQLRTNLQHAWATSLEIIDTLEKINLKTSIDGYPEWRKFFSITGELVAHKEKAITISNDKLQYLRQELEYLENKLEVRDKLLQFSLAINATTSKEHVSLLKKSVDMCLVTLNTIDLARSVATDTSAPVTIKVNIQQFTVNQTDEAIEALNESEVDKSILVSVLLATSDANNLRRAYPNYFGSMTGFSDFISKELKLLEAEKKN